MFTISALDTLKDSKVVLVAGCGGGYDIFAGLPLYQGLINAGKTVVLANLTFSNLIVEPNTPLYVQNLIFYIRFCTKCYLVGSESKNTDPGYFPEKYLCEYFKKQNNKVQIYTFDHSIGIKDLTAAYEAICKAHNIDTIVIADGGTDSLMRGNEEELGTPTEDYTSIAAVYAMNPLLAPKRYLWAIGFGIDTYHGVNHALFLENVSALIKQKGFLGCFTMTNDMPEYQFFREAAKFVFDKMSHHPSIVNTSIISATDGEFGDFHATHRTKGSKLFINSLMSQYWCFTVDSVAKQCLYLSYIANTNSRGEVQQGINKWRKENAKQIRSGYSLPV